MENLMCLFLGMLCMLILLHSSILVLGAFYFWNRREKTQKAEKPREKSEEERRAELEMKLFNEGVANILSYDTRPRGERTE